MIVAVSMRIVDNPTYYELRDAISHDWINFLDELSVTPILIPNVLNDSVEYFRNIKASGLLLTGGDNIGPLPGKSQIADYSNARDRAEISLLDYAVREKLPVFGVCRGLHLINIYFNGSIDSNISSSGKHVNTNHEIAIVGDPMQLFESQRKWVVNSYHNQGVRLTGLSPELEEFAIADGDIVEGLYHKSLPLFAVQWHPERSNPAADLDKIILERWLSKCAC